MLILYKFSQPILLLRQQNPENYNHVTTSVHNHTRNEKRTQSYTDFSLYINHNNNNKKRIDILYL